MVNTATETTICFTKDHLRATYIPTSQSDKCSFQITMKLSAKQNTARRIAIAAKLALRPEDETNKIL